MTFFQLFKFKTKLIQFREHDDGCLTVWKKSSPNVDFFTSISGFSLQTLCTIDCLLVYYAKTATKKSFPLITKQPTNKIKNIELFIFPQQRCELFHC